MKTRELLEILQGGAPTIRIIDNNLFEKLKAEAKANWNRPDEAVLECGYLDRGILSDMKYMKFYEYDVTHFKVTHEIHHREYADRGLMPPFRPDITAEYEFKDLKQTTYYDIYINYLPGKENTENA